MLGLSDTKAIDEPREKKHERRDDAWPSTIRLGLMLGFLAFALWLTANKFDASELKTILYAAVPFAVREFWPIIKDALKVVGAGIAAGNE